MKVTRFARVTAALNCAVPVTLLAWDAWHGDLGANPVNFAIRTTGMLSLIFLTLTLLVTPAARLTGWGWLGQFRRMLGLYAFFHGLLHFAIFFGLDRAGSVSGTFSEVALRPYLAVGALAVLLMAPLAATSTDAMVRRLGGRRWKRLHRLTYPVAILGVVHYYMLVKADVTQPLAFGAAVGALLGYRAAASAMRRRKGSHAAPKVWTGRLKVAELRDETPGVRTFRLVAPDSERLPFAFLPGQYLNVSFVIGGETVRRSYTIASSPKRLDACELTIKREDHGVCSKHLHDTVRQGDLVEVAAPAGRFTFTGEGSESVVLIAGGVGITPLMSKVRYLTDVAWPGEIHVVFSARTERDVIFRQELEALCDRFPNLRLTVVLSREESPSWPGERGRITPELLGRVVPAIAAREVHVCGPTDMMDAVVAMLRGLGVSDARIHLESFVRPAAADPPAPAASNGHAGPASVTFARSGRSKPLPPGQTVLEASEELGVEIPYDCRVGVCGTCKTRLISGRVVMDVDAALDPSDRAGNFILSCQARCVGEVVVEA